MNFDALIANADAIVCAAFNAAQTITYTPDGGSATTLERVIFDNSFISISAGQAGVTTVNPAIFCKLSDLPTDPEVDDPIINVDGQDYKVQRVDRDTYGSARIYLKKA